MPFINIYSELDGFNPCCTWRRFDAEDIILDVNEAFNGIKIKQIRQDMIDGKQISNCEDCYHDEKIGLTSIGLDGEDLTVQLAPTHTGFAMTTRGAKHLLRILPAHVAPLARHMIEKIPPDLSKFLICPMPGLLVKLHVEEGEEVLGQVVLVARVERADDAEVDGRVHGPLRVVGLHENIAGVHVGVEEIVPQHLREEDRHAVLGELWDVGAEFAQARNLGDRHAADALHDHDTGAAIVPVDIGNIQLCRSQKIAPQL